MTTTGALLGPMGLASDGSSLWVASFRLDQLARLNTATLAVEDRLRTGGKAVWFVAVGAGSLWATTGYNFDPGQIYRVDVATGSVERTITASVPTEIVFLDGAVWVADAGTARLLKIDPRTDRVVARVEVGSLPSGLAAGFGSLWVTSPAEGKVWRVASLTGKVEAIVPVGKGALGIAAGAGGVWVANRDDGTVSRIDPKTNAVVATIHTGFKPHWLAAADGAVWVSVAARTLQDELFGA